MLKYKILADNILWITLRKMTATLMRGDPVIHFSVVENEKQIRYDFCEDNISIIVDKEVIRIKSDTGN